MEALSADDVLPVGTLDGQRAEGARLRRVTLLSLQVGYRQLRRLGRRRRRRRRRGFACSGLGWLGRAHAKRKRRPCPALLGHGRCCFRRGQRRSRLLGRARDVMQRSVCPRRLDARSCACRFGVGQRPARRRLLQCVGRAGLDTVLEAARLGRRRGQGGGLRRVGRRRPQFDRGPRRLCWRHGGTPTAQYLFCR